MEYDTIADIRPQNILTFYYIEHYYRRNSDPHDRAEMNEVLDKIARNYLRAFSRLLYNQLSKYLGRNRVDEPYTIQPPTEVVTVDELEEYHRLMQTTYRSDMTRRNDRWNKIAEWTLDLGKAYHTNSYLGMFTPLDNLNNAVHNTTTKVFTKFTNGKELIQALNIKFRARHPSHFKYGVERQILRLRLIEKVEIHSKSNYFSNQLI